MSRIVDTYDPYTGMRTNHERPYDNRAYMSSDERYAYDDRHDYTRYTESHGNHPGGRNADYYNDNYGSGYGTSTPMFLAILGAIYIMGGLVLVSMGIIAIPPLALAGAASVVVGVGYIKEWRIMWYVGIVTGVALTSVAACLFAGVAGIPMLGFLFMPFAGAGVVINAIPVIYLLLPKVRAHFGV